MKPLIWTGWLCGAPRLRAAVATSSVLWKWGSVCIPLSPVMFKLPFGSLRAPSCIVSLTRSGGRENGCEGGRASSVSSPCSTFGWEHSCFHLLWAEKLLKIPCEDRVLLLSIFESHHLTLFSHLFSLPYYPQGHSFLPSESSFLYINSGLFSLRVQNIPKITLIFILTMLLLPL